MVSPMYLFPFNPPEVAFVLDDAWAFLSGIDPNLETRTGQSDVLALPWAVHILVFGAQEEH